MKEQDPKHRDRLQRICKGFNDAAERLNEKQLQDIEEGRYHFQLTPTVGKEGGGAGKQQHRSPFHW